MINVVMATRLRFCKAFYHWIMLHHGFYSYYDMIYQYHSPEVAIIWFQNTNFLLFVSSGIVMVVMATRCLTLQSVLLLDDIILQLPYAYFIMVCQYLSTEVAINCTKNTLKCQFWFLVFSGMLFVVMAT